MCQSVDIHIFGAASISQCKYVAADWHQFVSTCVDVNAQKYDVHTALRHIYKLVPPQANSNKLRTQNTMPVQCQMFRSPARAES